MFKVRAKLHLRDLYELSMWLISDFGNVGVGTVLQVLTQYRQVKLSWPRIEELSDTQLFADIKAESQTA